MSTPQETRKTSTNMTLQVGKGWQERDRADEIPCPALLSFYNNGLLNPDKEGRVDIAELDKALASVGVGASIRKVLVKTADESDNVKDGKFNLFKLRGSRVDHSGSTGVRDPKVDPAKLESILSRFSENGRMYPEHFAAVANHARKNDPGIKGTIIQTVELTALLEVFGRVDEAKKLYLTVDDVRGLWIHGKFPQDWQPHSADAIGGRELGSGVFGVAFERALKALGF